MKIQDITNSLEENFGMISSRHDHYSRHCNETGEVDPETSKKFPGAYSFKTSDIPDEIMYEKLADAAARRPLEKSHILGFIGMDGRCQKYNKDTEEFTSYTVDSMGNPVTITYFPMSREGWEVNKNRGPHRYKEPLTPEKDAKPIS